MCGPLSKGHVLLPLDHSDTELFAVLFEVVVVEEVEVVGAGVSWSCLDGVLSEWLEVKHYPRWGSPPVTLNELEKAVSSHSSLLPGVGGLGGAGPGLCWMDVGLGVMDGRLQKSKGDFCLYGIKT